MVARRLILLTLALTLGSCNSVEELCKDELPVFERDVKRAIARMDFIQMQFDESQRIAFNQVKKRRPAYSAEPSELEDAYALLNDADREVWRDWARGRLKVVQFYLDRMEEDNRAKESKAHVHSMANELVLLYGYADSGDIERMGKILASLQQKNLKLKTKLCSVKQ